MLVTVVILFYFYWDDDKKITCKLTNVFDGNAVGNEFVGVTTTFSFKTC
jgi:hypothetical protein